MNISDHFTRARYRQPAGTPGYRVIGIILGKQCGRTLEIMNTFEAPFAAQDFADPSVTNISINENFARTRAERYTEMFPDLEPLGWYSVKGTSSPDSVSDQPTAADLACMSSQIGKLCDNPIMMIMNPSSQAAMDAKKVPFFLYQKAPVSHDGQPSAIPFVQLDFSPASEASEQIAVSDVHIAVDKDAKTSELTQKMAGPINAVKILRSKLNFLIAAVKNSPQLRQNKGFMRRLNQIVSSTPITTTETYDSQFFGEYSDATALNMLTSVTQSCQQLQALVDDFKVLDQSKNAGTSQSMDDRMDMGFGGARSGGMMRQLNKRRIGR